MNMGNELNPLYRTLVGFDRIASLMDQAARHDAAPGYPPFNIERQGEDAYRIMLHVHQKGVGICGVYTFEVAETKVTQVMDFARQHGHPLQCTLEKE